MIKKIVCPTDFSPAATNAMEYAAKLAQELNSELQILNVQSLFPVVALPVGMNVHERVSEASETLAQTCSEINKMFHISCSYQIDATSESLTKAIIGDAEEDIIIVMGTNGVDDMYQYFFGTNTYNVIKNAKCIVLMIPENASFGTIKKIVFAWSYETDSSVLISRLNSLINIFNPRILFTPTVTFLHISEHESEITIEAFRSSKNEIESAMREKINVEFEQIYADNIPESINTYMEKSKSDMLMLTVHDRGLIGTVFHRSVSKKLSETAGYPILVMHA